MYFVHGRREGGEGGECGGGVHWIAGWSKGFDYEFAGIVGIVIVGVVSSIIIVVVVVVAGIRHGQNNE